MQSQEMLDYVSIPHFETPQAPSDELSPSRYKRQVDSRKPEMEKKRRLNIKQNLELFLCMLLKIEFIRMRQGQVMR